MGSNASGEAGAHGSGPRLAAVTFVTTEHFTLQGARAATTAESTGQATMFLGSVSAGLVALAQIATATRIGTAFYAFGLILLSTLSFVGFMTFQRVLRSGIEDHGYAERIARLRAYYFDCAPELVPYLASVPPPQRLVIHGLRGQLLAGLPDRRRNGWRRYSGPGRLRGWPAHHHRRWSFRGRRVRRRRDRGRRHPGGADGVPVPPISFSLRRRAKRARHRLAAAIMGPGSGFVSTHGSPSAGLLLLWACSREVCCPATPSRAWLSSRSRGNTVRRQRVMARTVTCCLL